MTINFTQVVIYFIDEETEVYFFNFILFLNFT